MSLPNILQWLSDSKKTGVLTITIRDEEKCIYLKDGTIFSASSNLEKDRFGIVIIKRGYVTQEQVDELLDEGRECGKLLGKLCVEKGLMPEDEVHDILQEQTLAIIESLLHREEGIFNFSTDLNDMKNLDQVPLSIAMQELFFGSAGARKEWKRSYETLGSLEAVPIPVDIQPGDVNSLSEIQQHILSRCNGKSRILDLFAEIDLLDFQICKHLSDLVEKKWLQIKNPTEAANNEYVERIWQVHIMIEQKRFLRATLLLDEISAMYPGQVEDIDPLIEKTKKLLSADIERLLSDDKLILYHKPNFDNMKVSGKTFGPQEWFMLSRIDGRTPLKEIFFMAGQSKQNTRRAIYALIDAGAIDIKDRENETRKKVRTIPVKPATQPEKTQQQSKNKTVFRPANVSNKNETINTIPLEAAELDHIYRTYLKQNHYQILNVAPDASHSEIRNEFVKLSRLYHPDMYDRKQMAPDALELMEALFSMVNHAYRIISNRNTRETYDQNLWVDSRSKNRSMSHFEHAKPFLADIVLKPKKVKRVVKKPTINTGSTGKHKKVEKPKSDSSEQKAKETKQKAETTPIDVKPTKTSLLGEAIQLFKDNKNKDAIVSLENFLKKNPKNAEAYYYISRCQQRIGGSLLSEALNNIKRALILDKENPMFFCQMGRVEIARENYSVAEKYIKTAMAWDSNNKEAKYLLGKIKEANQKGFFAKFKKKKKK